MSRRGRAFRRTSSSTGNPAQAAALATLLAAPGGDVFYDADFGVTKDGSNRVSQLASRIGSRVVQQAGADALKPVWTAGQSPTGRAGLVFNESASQHLADPATTLAGLISGTTPYSSLWVVKFTTVSGAVRCVWGAGNSGSTGDCITEGVQASALDNRFRSNAAASTANSNGSAHTTTIVCATTVYTGSAYSTWLNGSASAVAAANTRSATCDFFAIGVRRLSGALATYMHGALFGLIIAPNTQWSASERQALEAAAKVRWGTP